jgi:hypothetical protein
MEVIPMSIVQNGRDRWYVLAYPNMYRLTISQVAIKIIRSLKLSAEAMDRASLQHPLRT